MNLLSKVLIAPKVISQEGIDALVNQIKLCINNLEKNLPHISKESYQHSQKFSLSNMTKSYIDL